MVKLTLKYILFLLSLPINGQIVKLHGTINIDKTQPAEIQRYDDYISNKKFPIAILRYDDKGLFKTEITLSSPTKISLSVGDVSSDLHVLPGHTYNLTFNKQGSLIQVQSIDKTQNKIQSMDALVRDYYESHLKRSGEFKDSFFSEMNNLIEQIQQAYFTTNNPYLTNQIKYTVGLLNLDLISYQSDTVALNKLEQELLLNTQVLYKNDKYFSFLKRFYHRRWNWIPLRHFTHDPNKDRFIDYLNELSVIENDTIRQLAILNACKEAYTSQWGPGNKIVNNTLESIKLQKTNDEIEMISINLYRKYNKLKLGLTIKNFSFQTTEGEVRTLNDYRGKYALLDFWFTGCAYCIEAMPIKRKLKNNLPGLEILSIDPIDDLLTMRSWVDKHKYEWVFLNAKGNSKLLDYFTIDSYPSYFLLNPEGELLFVSKEFDISRIENIITDLVR